MNNRMGLAVALLLLATLVVVTLGLIAAVVAQAGVADLGGAVTQVWRGLQAMPPMSLGTAPAERVTAVAAAVVLAAVLAVPFGLALATLSGGLAWLARALLGVPAWAVLLVALLATASLLATVPLSHAFAEAMQVVRRPVGLRGALAVVWLPVLSACVERAARRIDPVRVRTYAGFGVGPFGRLWRIAVPAVATPLAGAAAVAFLVTATALLVAGEATGYDGSITPANLALVGVAGAAILAPVVAWAARPR